MRKASSVVVLTAHNNLNAQPLRNIIGHDPYITESESRCGDGVSGLLPFSPSVLILASGSPHENEKVLFDI